MAFLKKYFNPVVVSEDWLFQLESRIIFLGIDWLLTVYHIGQIYFIHTQSPECLFLCGSVPFPTARIYTVFLSVPDTQKCGLIGGTSH